MEQAVAPAVNPDELGQVETIEPVLQAPNLADVYTQISPALRRHLGSNALSHKPGFEPEDTLQTAALKLLPYWDEYMKRPDANPAGLFYRTADNLQKDAGRQVARRPVSVPATDQLLAGIASENDTATEAIASVEPGSSIALLFKTAALDAGQAEAVRLCHIEGESYTEIASKLGVPLGTVRSRIHRGMQKLSAYAARREITRPTSDLFDGTVPPTR